MSKNARESQQWEEASSATVTVLQDFRDAEMKRQTQLTNEANLIVEKAMASLKCRYEVLIFSHIISN